MTRTSSRAPILPTTDASSRSTKAGSELLFGWPKQMSAIPSATYDETEPVAASGAWVVIAAVPLQEESLGSSTVDGDHRTRTLRPPRTLVVLVFFNTSQPLAAQNP